MKDRLINIVIHLLQHIERSQPLAKEARSEQIERIRDRSLAGSVSVIFCVPCPVPTSSQGQGFD